MHWTHEADTYCISPQNLITVSICRTMAADESARMILGYPMLVHLEIIYIVPACDIIREKRQTLYLFCFFLSASAIDDQLGHNRSWFQVLYSPAGSSFLMSAVHVDDIKYSQMVFMERLKGPHLCLSCFALQNTLWLESPISDTTRIYWILFGHDYIMRWNKYSSHLLRNGFMHHVWWRKLINM